MYVVFYNFLDQSTAATGQFTAEGHQSSVVLESLLVRIDGRPPVKIKRIDKHLAEALGPHYNLQGSLFTFIY